MKKETYSKPVFVNYGKMEKLTKGTMLGGIPECLNGSWCAYRASENKK
jgi:hypothetical protein